MQEKRKFENLMGSASGPANTKDNRFWREDPVACLRSLGASTATLRLKKKEGLFYQAMPADCVFYLIKGRIKLTTVSTDGKEATIALMRAGDFLGEECVAYDQPLRTTTAIAISECAVLRTERKAVIEVLRSNSDFLSFFLSYVVSRNVRMQEDLIDRLFHTSEKRLARILLVLAGFQHPGQTQIEIPKVSQETLAEIVGTTRSRVSFFMNSFRRRGLIDYDGDYSGNIVVRSSLKGVLSQDK